MVDTIGVATELKPAMSFYSSEDRDVTGFDIEQAVGTLLDDQGRHLRVGGDGALRGTGPSYLGGSRLDAATTLFPGLV